MRIGPPAFGLGASKAHGLGLLARRDIKRAEPIMELRGAIVPVSEISDQQLQDWEWNALNDLTLLVRKKRSAYYYLNHSRSPNVRVSETGLQIISSRPIARGEELTLDYLKQPLPRRYLGFPNSGYLL
jgi:predicted DNA binding CopG/RHH family protein